MPQLNVQKTECCVCILRALFIVCYRFMSILFLSLYDGGAKLDRHSRPTLSYLRIPA